MVSVTLAGAGIIAVSPTVSAPDVRIANPAVRLTAGGLEDLGNAALNVFYDLVNIPANELDAIQELTNALFFGGSWLVTSGTNLWGIDVGDPPKIQALVDMLVPFPALSKPLGEQLVGLLEAELPTNPACISIFCPGLLDLLAGYFQVPLSKLMTGYTFPDSGPTVVDPYAPVEGALGFEGTHVAPDGSNVFPWAGTTFTLDVAKPFTQFFDSLIATPSDTPLEPFPNILQTFVNFGAALYVMFNPFLPGGTYIPSDAFTSNTGSLIDSLLGLDGVNLSAEASTLLQGLDLGDVFNLGSLGPEIAALLPGDLGSMVLGLL